MEKLPSDSDIIIFNTIGTFTECSFGCSTGGGKVKLCRVWRRAARVIKI